MLTSRSDNYATPQTFFASALILSLALGLQGCAKDDSKQHNEAHQFSKDRAIVSTQNTPPPTAIPEHAQRSTRNSVQAAWDQLSSNQKLAGVGEITEYRSWDDQLSNASVDQRAYLELLNEEFFGALAYSSKEEQAQHIRQGYPTVEEWLTAKGMQSSELERLAREGNKKAQAIYASRMASEVASNKLDGLNGNAPTMQHLQAVAHSGQYAFMFAQGNKSPFAAYLYGSVQHRLTGRYEPVSAALMLAEQMGDSRARGFAKIINQGDINATALQSNVATLRTAIGP